MTEPFPNNVGVTIGTNLRPVVASLGSTFFTNTVTIQGVQKTTTSMGEEVLEYTTILEHIPAMFVKIELNAGREETTMGSVEAEVKTAEVTLGGYFPEIQNEMRLIEEQSGTVYDIVGFDHPAIAMTILVAVAVDPTGAQS